jgi:hypothetical protein
VELSTTCVTISDTINVNYNALPTINLGVDTTLCQGQTLALDATNISASYLWQDSSINPIFIVTEAASYWVQVNIGICSRSDSIEIIYISPPSVDLGNNTSLCDGVTLLLDATNSKAMYLWQDGSDNPTFNVIQPGMYWVIVSNNCGVVTDSVILDLAECDCLLCVPDAFTPNGLGIDVNNRLYVFNKLGFRGDALEMINFKIFNRWGEIIFEANEISQIVYPDGGWDGTHMRSGKKLEVGVYVWLMEAQTVKGDQIGPISGNVSLIR